VSGPLRAGRRTKHLVKRLQPGEVALIDHADLDRVSAEDLIGAGVAAVLNCRTSSSLDYPNMGPAILADAGIPLVDLPDDSLFDSCRDGDGIEVRGGEVWSRGELVASGELLDPAVIRRETEQRRREIGGALESFARNTVEHMVEEQDLLSGRIELPPLRTEFRDRPALVVVRGVDHQADLVARLESLEDEKFGKVSRDGRSLLRYRARDYRIYFEAHPEGLLIHRVLHKNTIRDFLFRSNLPIDEEDGEVAKTNDFWSLIREAEEARK